MSGTPSVMASTMRIFDLSLGQMLWSRRSVFLGVLLGGPVVLAVVLRIVDTLHASGFQINGAAVGGSPRFGMMICLLFIRSPVPVHSSFSGPAPTAAHGAKWRGWVAPEGITGGGTAPGTPIVCTQPKVAAGAGAKTTVDAGPLAVVDAGTPGTPGTPGTLVLVPGQRGELGVQDDLGVLRCGSHARTSIRHR